MTPLDDELRTALAARAAALPPSSDPLAGIERRAARIHRRRALTAALGAALAVCAVAVTVPALSGSSRAGDPSRFVTQEPSESAPAAPPPLTPPKSPAATATTAPTTTTAARPANLLSWPAPGVAPRAADVAALEKAFAGSLGRASAQAAYRPLHSDLTESGVRYTVGQAWIPGDAQAYDVSWMQDRDNPPVFQRRLRTPTRPSVRAYVLGVASTFSSDLLVVVPRPGIGQLSYSPDATRAFSPLAGGSASQIALLPRAAGTTADRIEVLDGDGNLDHPLYRGLVNAIVCGAPTCP